MTRKGIMYRGLLLLFGQFFLFAICFGMASWKLFSTFQAAAVPYVIFHMIIGMKFGLRARKSEKENIVQRRLIQIVGTLAFLYTKYLMLLAYMSCTVRVITEETFILLVVLLEGIGGYLLINHVFFSKVLIIHTRIKKSASFGIMLLLAAFSLYLLTSYQADTFLYVLTLSGIAYALYFLSRKKNVKPFEIMSAILVICTAVLFVAGYYLGDNSRAFGYGGDPDPGFARGYGGSLVLLGLFLLLAGFLFYCLWLCKKNNVGILQKRPVINKLTLWISGISVTATATVTGFMLISLIADIQSRL